MTPLLVLEGIQDRGSVIKVTYSIRDAYSRENVGFINGHIIDRIFFVDDIFGPGKWGLGVRGVRGIIRRIQADFPTLQMLKGPRISGARMVSGVVNGSGHARL